MVTHQKEDIWGLNADVPRDSLIYAFPRFDQLYVLPFFIDVIYPRILPINHDFSLSPPASFLYVPLKIITIIIKYSEF